jgi:meiotic recombination protein REC8, fungi type
LAGEGLYRFSGVHYKLNQLRDNPHDQDDQDFDPTNKRPKQKKKPRHIASMENLRTNLHILNEDLSHILSNSFEASFSEQNSGMLGIDLSSQSVGAFAFEDDIFGALQDLDLGGDIGDELARELGEGWGGNNSIV